MRGVGHWEYRGDFHVKGSTEDPKVAAQERVESEDPFVKSVLYLEQAK